ncbi:phosphoribosylglycinamide formyltransferase [Listeria ivanovii]|uniref:Phosphoribosylglycinamide formyltransferase n=2 Tax=Listeria ivanovii TaxID=1638 RepID=A0ABS1G6V6_LISIV|nr:phosphoribosylglycinamide formyltransferase [Listeria ivanovii]EFR96589.1 phosphoribosylglycinamide formyltransferase [Listeria ivanovii FSL F6-596]AIS60170.1 phosphoribosylglycinamide formyltransferase [Listeria ivanovii subsp. londoniensis]AIS62996.1 phosphoribosylglycinamide formyltransferase [Listeria ivanovii subsp. londoniensis]MBC2256241.1 phosphoribosylglycinamide formyltransferase [Listeria ivanovii]MBK1962351.1 phosphoribosylglycinamide formyltransferase [Listeria ivanovii subsp. 
MNIAVFASGNGSNFQALVDDERIKPHIRLLVCDKPNAYVLERAAKNNIPIFLFEAKKYPDKEAFETEILLELRHYQVDLLVLAGYMRLIGPTLLAEFPKQIVNLHPSLLPAFKGKDAIKQALQAGVSKTGVTAHFVDAGMDTGPIIDQVDVPIASDETVETLAEKIHQVEHVFYPKVIRHLIQNGGEEIHYHEKSAD